MTRIARRPAGPTVQCVSGGLQWQAMAIMCKTVRSHTLRSCPPKPSRAIVIPQRRVITKRPRRTKLPERHSFGAACKSWATLKEVQDGLESASSKSSTLSWSVPEGLQELLVSE
eukprot:3844927-Amphidinium_carterae.1